METCENDNGEEFNIDDQTDSDIEDNNKLKERAMKMSS